MSFGCPVEKTRNFYIFYCSIGFKVSLVHYFIRFLLFQISVSVKLTFTNYPNPDVLPPEQVIAANGTTAFEFLQLASQLNPCYLFNYTQFSFGRYITTICCIEENKAKKFYWFIFLNGKLSPVGADLLKPKNGDTLTFEYQMWKTTDHTTPAPTPRSGTPRSGTPRSGTPRSGTPRSGTPIINPKPTGKGQQMPAASLNVFISMAIGILVWKY
jgi:hypothetical protein